MTKISYDILDMDETEYRNHSALANTDIRNAQLLLLGKQPHTPKKALREGTYLHSAILEPESWLQMEKSVPDKQAKRINRIAQTARNYTLMQEMMSHPRVQIEKCVFWKDPITGLACKAKPDLFIEGEVVMDLKTTSRTIKGAFENQVLRNDFDRQIAFYNIPIQAPIARVIGVSKISKGKLFRLDWNKEDEYLSNGREKANILLKKLADDPQLIEKVIGLRKFKSPK
ncbi:PD-(D/E)XK nuclease-like domain-containing protein [Flammeovirga pacifica]|uniref:Putative exodeoxyribonuclease 8 PDDEXK-like domain-containing protein n=1 Tax=Flammeovirga pacifica TaxID=915059 RepID=A0A1S1Z3V9_FLAPC|nr:PD-(D/E)XK nuclease-like domain-containing protein [Flammeovirga pacifica]OHX67960.1 hypothetical protein NH26_17235 [Flammeovirga pacifica]